MKKKADLSLLLNESTRKPRLSPVPKAREGGREGTVPITVHLPKVVRDQLKLLAVQTDTEVYDLAAQAFNMLFARHRLPEIAPRKPRP
jgi:hypothetical protein